MNVALITSGARVSSRRHRPVDRGQHYDTTTLRHYDTNATIITILCSASTDRARLLGVGGACAPHLPMSQSSLPGGGGSLPTTSPSGSISAVAPSISSPPLTSLPVLNQLEDHLIPTLDRIERLSSLIFERLSDHHPHGSPVVSPSRDTQSLALPCLYSLPYPALLCRDNSALTPYTAEQASGKRLHEPSSPTALRCTPRCV